MPRFASLGRRAVLPLLLLQASGLGLLSASPALAQQPLVPAHLAPGPAPCVEGPARLAARIAYAEARVAPSADQQEAWRAFVVAWRAAFQPMDALCREAAPPRADADPGARLDAMQRHAAAMAQVLAGLHDAVRAVEPSLTSVQKEILARAVLPPPPPAHGPRPMGHLGPGMPRGEPWEPQGFGPGADDGPQP